MTTWVKKVIRFSMVRMTTVPGTSTLLAMAEAFAEARAGGFRPDRTILFMLVTGEEKGLLGSEFYVNNPAYPLNMTVADVNVDMVGRQDDKYKDNPDYIYVIGSDRLSTDLHKINEAVNAKYCQLTLDYTYNAEEDPNKYYTTDQTTTTLQKRCARYFLLQWCARGLSPANGYCR